MCPANTCQDIKIVTTRWAYENSWTFGSCSGPASGTQYSNYDTKTEQCCQGSGTHILTCKDSYGDGWSPSGAYIEIGGTKYCENFLSGRTQTHSIMTSGSSLGTYSLTDENQLCKDISGETAVLDLNDCLMAVTYFQGETSTSTMYFVRSLSSSTWPSGCFRYYTRAVYFNTYYLPNADGNAHHIAKQICKPTVN